MELQPEVSSHGTDRQTSEASVGEVNGESEAAGSQACMSGGQGQQQTAVCYSKLRREETIPKSETPKKSTAGVGPDSWP